MKLTKEVKCILDIYRECYKVSEPVGDFDFYMETCPKNERGEIEIPFDKHEMLKSDFDRILKEQLLKYKIKSPNLKNAIKVTVTLGCSPKFKNNE
jgi:hypothetical protein